MPNRNLKANPSSLHASKAWFSYLNTHPLFEICLEDLSHSLMGHPGATTCGQRCQTSIAILLRVLRQHAPSQPFPQTHLAQVISLGIGI